MGEKPSGKPPAPSPKPATPLETMAHRLQTPEGKKLYGLHKQTPKPVLGIIKSLLGFRQFMLRGMENRRSARSLVTMAGNLQRMFVLVGMS